MYIKCLAHRKLDGEIGVEFSFKKKKEIGAKSTHLHNTNLAWSMYLLSYSHRIKKYFMTKKSQKILSFLYH